MSKLKKKEDFDQQVKDGRYDNILEEIFKSGKYIHQ
jgi:hypothetical protein